MIDLNKACPDGVYTAKATAVMVAHLTQEGEWPPIPGFEDSGRQLIRRRAR